MTPAIVIAKLVTFEMSYEMGQEEASSSSKGKALTCSEKEDEEQASWDKLKLKLLKWR